MKLSQSLLCISRARNYKNASLYEIADAILNSAPKFAHSDCIKTSDGSCIRKAKRLISLGRLSDAIKSLDSFGLHQYSEEIISILEAKHPQVEERPTFDRTYTKSFYQREDVISTLYCFPKGSTGGPSGLTSQMLIDFHSDPQLKDAFIDCLTSFAGLFASAVFPDLMSPYYHCFHTFLPA